ncbi:MAG: PH domain-containing protein [Patescibacteria group bacterium]
MIILRENEKIIKRAWQHWTALVPRILMWAVILGFLFAVRYSGDFDFYGEWRWVGFIASALAVIGMFWKIALWRASVVVLTNQRVYCGVRTGIFSKTVIELLYKDIKEVSYVREGIMASIFRYGDLHLMSAADATHVFERIPKPEYLVEIINKVR